MHGNFSRDTFDVGRPFSRVLMQQGRVLLDADWNEQTATILHYLRTLAADLIGPYGGPGDGFRISSDDDFPRDFVIGRGHYYVDGILCENDLPGAGALRYTEQPHYPLRTDDPAALRPSTAYLVYLDVWERHLNHLQADRIREVALGGPDTATRAEIVYQVRVAEEPAPANGVTPTCGDLLRAVVDVSPPSLSARARVTTPSEDPCIIGPLAGYRGPENQLYRVEIQHGGEAGSAGATFTWSRDNGSAVFGIRSMQGETVTVDSLGADAHGGLKEGDWVEIVDDRSALRQSPRPLVVVDSVDRVGFTVRLRVPDGTDLPTFEEGGRLHPLLRRWDQGSDALPVEEDTWVDLEDGVQVSFSAGGTYRSGDHWLIPARTATGDVQWPTRSQPDGRVGPAALPPHGIEHHYAPLARIVLDDRGVVAVQADCRSTFHPTETTLGRVLFDQDSSALSQDAVARLTEDAPTVGARLATDPNLRVEVRGYGSADETDVDELASARAEAVRQFYSDNDVPSGSLWAVARGAADPIGVAVEQRRRVETVLVSGGAAHPPVRHPVRTIDGVGEKFARRLEHAGITDAGQVVGLTPERLTVILSAPQGRAVPESTASTIIENARKLISGATT